MQSRSNFVHLITYNTTVKTEFKINIIWVRLIILKFFTMQAYVIWCSDNLIIYEWYGSWQLVDDVNILHVKKLH
jgi:hypothetical protein